MHDLGQVVEMHTLSDTELLEALKAKLLEESKEFKPTEEKALKELADILEVIEVAARQLGSDLDKLRVIQAETREKRGGFDGRVFVETVSLKDDDEWVKYYVANPDTFPEIPVSPPAQRV